MSPSRPYLCAFTTAILTLCGARAQQPAPWVRMPPDAHPAFAVATIKPHDPAIQRSGFSSNPALLTIRNESVVSMIVFAYSLNKRQLASAPGWAESEYFDIEGRGDVDGQPNLPQYQEMVRKLLAERFQLKFHMEKRELSVYAVRVAKSGLKLTSAANPDGLLDQTGSRSGSVLTIKYTSCSMPDFAFGEQPYFDRPVIDQTGIAGRFDFTLRYTPDSAATSDDPDTPPGIFTAIQEQLGLKIEPSKAMADVLVLDRIERPSGN